ncbi:MAG: helix-turn-helix domain-containing protein [Clostridia bacterium]|nr:helix-turn-helix domain-containing protein [Clostridia bacterium]
MKEESFGERLKKAMQIRNMNAATLSRKTGIKPPMISEYLSGKCNAKQDKLYVLAKELDVNEAWLMGFDVSISRIPDVMRNEENKIILEKIEKLSKEQKEIIIKMIDNMK